MTEYQPAREPEDLSRLFIERANAGDVAGVVALYEPGAVLEHRPGETAVGRDAIRRVYEELLAPRPRLEPGPQRPAVQVGDLALTSTRLPGGGATAEVAHRQPDGTWRWLIDRPAITA